ncbi:MAG: EAL domain-containing protein [Gammaproteobacteria bacterium]|nr:EAL domain-containing protein [Gammaproteobacteria bacterium]
MTGRLDLSLVVLSVVVACVASYVALDVASRVAAATLRRGAHGWLVAGALSMGAGIWSMHFIGMLAWRLPIPMSYDVPTTVVSMLIAAGISGLALNTASHGALNWRRLGGAGLLMGIGISAMHYVGMAAMTVQPPIRYEPVLFTLSLFTAVGASLVALWIAFRLRGETVLSAFWRRGGGALAMGGAIAGMHYTGMAAVIVAPNAICTVPKLGIDNVWLASGIGCVAVLILAATILISIVDERSMRRVAGEADQLRESEEKYRLLWETTSDAAVLLDERGQIEFANSALADVFGYTGAEVIGQNVAMLQPPALRGDVARYFGSGGDTRRWRAVQTRGLHRDGHTFPIEITFRCLVRDGRPCFAGFMRDIAERHHAENLLAGQKQVLEAIVAGRSLDDTLAAIVLLLEREFPRTFGSILVLDETGTRLARGVAPNLSPDYNDALIGLEIGPEVGSCGAAAYSRELVVVSDIATDPKWADFRELALRHGLKACWSQPIISDNGRLFGTLGVYSREPHEPSAAELNALRTVAPLAAIAIEHALREAQIGATNERFQLIARATQDAICDWDIDKCTVWWNDQYAIQFGHDQNPQPSVESWSDYLHPEDRERMLATLRTAIVSGVEKWNEEYRFRRHDGGYATVLGRAFVARDAAGRAVRVVGSMMDITDRKRSEEQLAYLAQYDTLTGLPNRNLFKDRLGQAIVRADRADRLVALLYIDLDGFKEINDTLGHGMGDGVLQIAAARLRACVRESDTVARLGGDEFTIILEDAGSAEEVAEVARKILDTLTLPMAINGRELLVTGSLGIAVYPRHGDSSEILVQYADMAMYRAKSEGRNNFQFYAPAMGVAATARMDMESKLRQALANNEFILYYQPLVSLVSGAITGVEALLRWQHPEWGLTPPGRFIEVAEHSGLIVPLGDWVLAEACAQVAAWRAAGLPPVQVSVNVSAHQLRNAELLKGIVGALARNGLTGNQLKLEITESLLMERPAESARLLARVRALGVGIAVDDFGTGYSSLAYLKHFPLDTLKIDRSFVSDVTTDPNDATMVKTMIGLAHNLSLSLTAEGVETPEQLAFLLEHGCETGQGYLFSRPVPAADFARLLGQSIKPDSRQSAGSRSDAGRLPSAA